MDQPVSPPRNRRTIIVVSLAALVAAAVIGVGLYGLAHSLSTPTPAETSAGSRPTTTSTGPTSPVPTAVPTIPATVDAEQFARRVAVTLFAWDTSGTLVPADYMQAIVDVGDPSGSETPGLAVDLADYLPNMVAWAQLRTYETRQWLTIDTATVPSTWGQAFQQGKATLLPGTTAYTITGIRHRVGVWDGKPVTTSGQVSFTVFETCQPTYPTCRLLRLSRLDDPLP